MPAPPWRLSPRLRILFPRAAELAAEVVGQRTDCENRHKSCAI
jgi:hypothetical protein